jgi:UDP-glucose 4-epimerase
LETVSLRYFNVFGADQDPHSEYSAVIPKFVTRLILKEPILIHGDGEQSRDFTHFESAVEANLLALRATEAKGRVCNVGCGERISLNRLIDLLEEIVGLKATVSYIACRPGDVRHSLADITTSTTTSGL